MAIGRRPRLRDRAGRADHFGLGDPARRRAGAGRHDLRAGRHRHVIGVKYSDIKRNAEFNEAVGDFVSQIIYGEPGRFERYSTLAVHDNGRLIAGVLYHYFRPRDGVIEMSAGSLDKRWLTRPVLAAMFAVPFDSLRLQV